MPMVKNEGTVRVCGDYKLTENKVPKTDMYPLLKIEELLLHRQGVKCLQN